MSQQLKNLSTNEHGLIKAATVLGNHGAFDVLQTMTKLPKTHLTKHLRALMNQNLLTKKTNDDFSFHHTLIHDTILHQMLSHERHHLHTTTLQTLHAARYTNLTNLTQHATNTNL